MTVCRLAWPHINVECAQKLCTWLDAVFQAGTQDPRNTWNDYKFKKRLLSPVPVRDQPLLGKQLRSWPNMNLKLGSLFLNIIDIIIHINQMFVSLRRPIPRGQDRGVTNLQGRTGNSPAGRSIPKLAASNCCLSMLRKGRKSWCCMALHLLPSGVVSSGHCWCSSFCCLPLFDIRPSLETFACYYLREREESSLYEVGKKKLELLLNIP